jgi:hypothetical protein
LANSQKSRYAALLHVIEGRVSPKHWIRVRQRDPSICEPLAVKNVQCLIYPDQKRTAARHFRRQETARPLLDDIRSKIEAAQSAALPSSALSKACQYALVLWKKLIRFLEYPELERKRQRKYTIDKRLDCELRDSLNFAQGQEIRFIRFQAYGLFDLASA